MTANRKLETPFLPKPRRPDDFVWIFQPTYFRLCSSGRDHRRIFSAIASYMTSPQRRVPSENLGNPPSASSCVNASLVFFCAASSTAFRYSALRCRRMAVNWPDLNRNAAPKSAAHRHCHRTCCPVSPDKMIRASRAQSNSRFMSSIPTAPASSRTHHLVLLEQ